MIEPGTYQVIVTNAITGCSETGTTTIPPNTTQLISTVSDEGESCVGDENGLIVVDEVVGGVAPYMYSLNGGFTYINSSQTIADTSTLYYLGTSIVNTTSSDIGIAIKFTTISGLSIGDYWEFDCSPPYVVTKDDEGNINPPTETNFLGEFGKVYPRNELLVF